MGTENLILTISRLSLGALATFFAIFLWSRTREPSWMFIIIGTVLRYVEIMYKTFEIFGIVQNKVVIFNNIPLSYFVLEALPPVFFTVGFILMIKKTLLS